MILEDYVFQYSAEPCPSGTPNTYVLHADLLCATTKDVLLEHEQPVKAPADFLTRTSENMFLRVHSVLKVMEVQTWSAWVNALARL